MPSDQKIWRRWKREQIAKDLKLKNTLVASDRQVIEYLKRLGIQREPNETRFLQDLLKEQKKK